MSRRTVRGDVTPSPARSSPSRRLLIYDPDGLNPYGRELAALLAESGFHVCLVLPEDASWVPLCIDVRPVLPSNGPRSKWRQAVSLVRGTLITMVRAINTASPVIIVWTRSWLDEMAFALLSALRGNVIVVVHNTSNRSRPSRVRSISQRLLIATASRLIVHSRLLLGDMSFRQVRASAMVCRHLPYTTWASLSGACPSRPTESRKLRALVLGQLRPDKGVEDLPKIFQAMPGSSRARIVVTVCGRGTISARVRKELDALRVDLDDRSSLHFVPDNEVRRALRESDVLLAPYTGATQSGSITAALSMSLPVLAFDDGAIGELVSEAGLVARGNHAEMGARLTALLAGELSVGSARLPLAIWRKECADEWIAALALP